ncbi:MAG: BREX-1 system phosphatase PglZ type A [Desulfosporosinus sp.]
MNLDQINVALTEKFRAPSREGAKRHIIFWYDAEGDFQEFVDELELAEVKLWKLTETNKFLSKYTLEVIDPNSNYLIYAAFAKPDDANNWLLDIMLYSQTFIADKIALMMDDLHVENNGLRPCFMNFEKFFNSKDRYARFASYSLEAYTEETIHIGVLAALAKRPTPDFEDALRVILINSLQEDENTVWQNIVKYGVVDGFWNLTEKYYGYFAPEKNLKGLLTFFIINALSSVLNRTLPLEWQGLVSAKRANCVVFLDHFMHHSMDSKIYDKLAEEIEADLHFGEYLEQWDIQDYEQVDLFRAADRSIILKLTNSLLIGSEEFTQYKKIISLRKTKHYYQEFENYYEAMFWTIEMYAFKKKYQAGIPERDALTFFEAYTKEYFIMDQAYRKFCVSFDQEQHSDVLKPLSAEVDNLYTNWYHTELAVKWSAAVAEELAASWPIQGMPQQQGFFRDTIQKALYDNKKSFVIISDALRFEAAEELMQRLNTEIKGSTELRWMQGCVPSYTRLGMAALLPHTALSMQGDDVLIEGISTKDTNGRRKILKSYVNDSEVVLLNDLIPMTRTELRNTFKGKSVVYIYHNVIDSMGDKGDESKTFHAVEQAFAEIQGAIRTINKNLTEANIYITSDHGFIYRRKALAESDKTTKGDTLPLYTNKRFLIFDQEVDLPGSIKLSLDYFFGKDCGLTVCVPRGDNRYKTLGGGQNYVHGGASLQEIVIPLIKYRNDRKKDERMLISKVEVKLTNTSRKITNSLFSLDFFQTEKLMDKKVARTVKLYFTDEAGQKISNEQNILADRISEKASERTFKVSFNLKSSNYNKLEKHYLVLEDPEEPIKKIYDKIPFSISLGIVNEFDF